MKFKVGDKVKIVRDSQYYGQSFAIGTIKTTNIYDSYHYYVIFADGQKFNYRDIDLKLAKKKVITEKDLIL